MGFRNGRWKSAVSWMLIAAMLGGYGNTAMAAGVTTSGNEGIEYIQGETEEAGTEETVPGGAETVAPGGESDPEEPEIPGSGEEPGTEEEKPSEGETDPKEDTDPSAGEEPSENTDSEEPVPDEALLTSQPERAYQPHWPDSNFTNLVVFVDFADTTHNHPASIYPDAECFKENPETTFRYFNGDAQKNYKGMRQYLYNISYGQLQVENVFPQFDQESNTITAYTLPQSGAYYKDHESEMIREIIGKLKGQLPQGLTLDMQDGDGILDNLTVVVPCDSENKTTLFVGHKTDYKGNELLGGTLVRSYNVLTEEDIYFGQLKSGVIIHEFLHTMGYPDLYRSVKNVEVGKNIPVSLWDIMATDNHRVQYPLAYLRSAITGWFEIPALTESRQGLSLYAASRATKETKDQQALILKTDYSDSEFFVVEYRRKGSSGEYEENIPGSGLIVYRVDTNYATNITGPPDFIYVFRPGDKFGSHGYEEAGGDYYNSYLSQDSGRTSYGSSDPKASLFEGALTYSDGTNSGIEITNVGNAGGDEITFDVTFHDLAAGEAWKTVAREEAGAGTSSSAYCMGADGRLYALLKKGTASSSPAALYECKEGKFVKLGDAPAGYEHQLAEYGGSLYAAYFDRAFTARLARWNGSFWQELYRASQTGNELSLASDNRGVYLAYTTGDYNAAQIFAAGYSEAGIFEMGSQVCASAQGLGNLSMAAEDGNVVAAYRAGSRISVKQYNAEAKSWSDVGSQSFNSNGCMVGIHNRKVYLMNYLPKFLSSSGQLEAYLYAYDMERGSSWEQVGENAYSDSSVGNMALCFDGDAPYIAYTSGSDPIELKVKQLQNNQWTDLGAAVARENAGNLHIFAYGGQIYAAYQNTANSYAAVRSHGSGREEEGEQEELIWQDTIEVSNPFQDLIDRTKNGDAKEEDIAAHQAGIYADSFGGQIENPLAKEIYDLLVDRYARQRLVGSQEAQLEHIIAFPAKIQVVDGKNQLVPDANSMAAVAQFVQCFQLAFGAFYMDYPSVFWMQGMSLSYGMKYSSETGKAYITDIELKPGREFYEGASGQVSAYDAAVQEAKAEIEAEMDASGADKENRYQLVKAIHTYLCEKLSYDTEAGDNLGGEGYGYAHTSSTVFLGHNGEYKVVCEGYAKAFKVLCEQWEIPCTLVIGQGGIPGSQGPHMWNYVQMEDGQWYGMDATWNDQDNGMRLEYFLAGSSTPGFDYGGISFTFAEEHQPDMEIMTGLLYPFVYPKLSEGNYVCRGVIQEDENGKQLLLRDKDIGEPLSEERILEMLGKHTGDAPFDGISILCTDNYGSLEKKLSQAVINQARSLLKYDGELVFRFWESGSGKLTQWHLKELYKARRDYDGTVTAAKTGAIWSLSLSDTDFPAKQVWVSYGEQGLSSYQEADAQDPRTIYYYAEADGERELAGQGEYEHIPAEESEFGELHILNLYDINGLKPGTAYLAETSRSDWRLEYGYRVDEKGEETKGTVEYFGSEEALIAALCSKDAGGNIRIACTGEEQPESIPAELLNLCGQKNWNLEYIRREDTAGVTYVWNLKGLKTGNEAFALDVALSTQEEDLPVEFRERTYIQVEPKGSLPEGASVVLTIRQEGIAGRFGDEKLLRLWKREGRKLTFRGTAKPDREEGNWISFELKEASGTVYVISSQSEYGWQMVPDEEDNQKEQAVYIENRSGQRVVGWEIVEGRKCYFNEKGYLVQGPSKVDGVWYLFGYYVGNTWGIRTGLVTAAEEGCTYYANEAGVLQKGWQKIRETWHYFSQDEETFGQEVPSMQEGYWVTMEGRRYYFRNNKSLLKNWQTVDGKRYFFTPEGYARTGWYPNPADKNAYYLNELGEMETGYAVIETEAYFFHTNGLRQYGWQRVPDENGEYRWRYFNGDPLSEKYAYGQEIDSEPKGGYWYEMEGETYYFTKNTKLATGWQTIDGKRYYFDSRGSMYTGTQKIGSSYYHFCTEQGLEGVLGTGLFEDGGSTYYANGSGVLQRGWQKIDGEWRFFHHETGAEEEGKIQTNYWAVVSQGEGAEPKIFYFLNGAKIATGWQTIEGRRYYFDGNGILKTGFFQVGKNTYYGRKAESLEETEILESHPGEVLSGEQNIDGGVYYFGSSYELYTGWQRIDNVWRYFSMEETSPARGKEKQTSGPEIEETWYWYTTDGGRYCFRNNASLLKGWQTINGERYYLDPATGAAVTGTEDKAATLKIGNYVYCFDEKGVMQKDTVVEGYGYNAKGYRVSGWQKLNGRWHYFDASDAKNPDTWKEVQQAESGRGSDWITLDFGGERGQETYYFRNNSSLVKNWQNIDGRRYYFDPKTGALQTGNEDGWYVIKSNAYYLGEDGALRYGWIREKAGQTYYANSSGVLLRGWQKIDNLWYYFSRENYQQDTDARVERDYFATAHEGGREDTYYFVNGTTLAKGWQTIGGIRYYFDTATNVLQTGFFQVGKGWYCFLEDHTPRTGWWKRPETGRYYYFNANGQAVTGWQTIKSADGTSAKYYFDANGVMQTQRTKIGNTWYFFGPDGKMRTGFVKYCDTTYYFKGNGQMLKGWQTIEGQRYYFDGEGSLQTGFITIGKSTYYFDERFSALGQMLKGEQEIQGAVYYFNNSGVLQYGWQRLNYVWRFFDLETGAERNTWKSMDDWMTIQISETETARSFINNGTAVLKNWQTIGGKRYYFDGNGLLWTQDRGWLTVGKNQFYFKEDGSVFQGFLELEGDTYYLNANGQMQKGWQTVKEDGVSSKYYLDPASGQAWKGHQQIGKNWYYFDPADHGKMAVGYVRDAVLAGYYYNSSGVRQSGWQKVDVPEEGNVWKYFAPETGKECPVTIDENYWATVDLGEDRTERAYLKGGTKILTGWQTINEKRYYFDSQGFQWTEEKKWLTIGKNRYYFDSSKDNSVYQGFLAPDGNTYYLNANGQMLTGWQTITFEGVKGKYYLDPSDGAAFMGHRQVGKNWYYFDPTDHGKMAVGYITDADGDHYYYNNSGVLLTGWQKVEGSWKYFAPETGKECTVKADKDKDFWVTVELEGGRTERAYLKDGEKILTGWQSIKGADGTEARYYFDSQGFQWTEEKKWLTIGKNRYYFDGSKDSSVYQGFLELSGNTYYLNAEGRMLTGWQTVDDGNGDSARYYFNANGVMLEGVSWIGKDRYVFRDSGKEAGQLVMGSDSLDEGSGMAQIQGVGTCYADKNGKLKTGWSRFTKGGDYEWKYLLEETGAEQTVQNLSEAAGEEQRVETDSRYVWYQVAVGEGAGTYCIYDNKTLLKKYQSIGGRRYYFDASSGKLQKGWFLAGANRCYGDPVSGEIRSGRQQIGADWYYLNGDGKFQTGWQNIKAADGTSARYYFDEKGVLQTGFQQIGKATYYLLEDEGTENGASEDAGAMQTGLVIIGDGQNAGTYYFNGKGEMQKGWISLNMPEEGVVWKYFGADGKEIEPADTGSMPSGVVPLDKNSVDDSYTWYQIGDDWYCIQSNKTLVKGRFVSTGGYKFYLDKSAGALMKGHFLDGKTHCYSDAGDGRIEPSSRLLEETDGESGRVVRYYFDGNGKRVTGWKTVEGPDGNEIKYYFEPSNGQAACGWKQIGKQAYYFDRNSGELKKAMAEDLLRITEAGGREVLYYTGGGEHLLSGLYSVKGEWYYFDPATKEGGEVTAIQDGRNTLIVLENGTKHLLKDGKTLAKGWQTITVDGEKGSYYFDSQGVLKKGWINDGKKRYYTDENTGKAISGFMTFVDGVREEGIRVGNTYNSYYFDANGLMKTGWITLADAGDPKVKHVYYCNANGILLKGICWIGNKRYVLDPDTGERISDSVEIGGVRYYANGDGILKTGWQKAGGKSYYYGTDGQRAAGWKEIDGKVYYFDAAGTMQTGYQTGLPVQGSQADINTADYYFNNSGVLQTGWFRFSENKENVWKFFGKDGKEMEPKIDRDAGPKGDKVNGYRWYLVNNDWYCIQKDSKVLKGFYNIGTWRYYFDSTTGALKKGHFTDGKSWYYSDPATGAINRSGYKLEEMVRDRKEISYFDGNGKRVTGWKTIEEQRYYFEPSDGLAASGFVRIGKQDYYFDVDTKVLQKSMLEKNAPLELISVQRNGREVLYYTGKYEYLLSGWQKVNGSWYYFDAVTKEGEEAQVIPGRDGNWVELGDRSQYYFKNGTTLARDWQTISVNGDSGRYYFDKNGVLQTGWLGISGKRYYTDELTGKAAKEEFLYFVDGVCQREKPESGEFDTYYFDKNGLMKTGWLTLTESDGVKRSYYFNISGEMRKGLCWVGNTCYVLDPKEGFRIENGSVVIDGKTYYANSKGILKTGWEKVNGKSYYYGTDGQRAAGWKEIEGKVYYFDTDQDDAMQIGYRKELPVRGSLQSGEDVEKAAYYFNGSGVMQTGWFLLDVPEEGRIWKYFGTDGREILPADEPAEVTPEGEDSPGYIWYRVEEPGADGTEAAENWYCIYKNKVLKGSNKIVSWKYYFDSATGALQKGHFTVGTARYYSKPDTGAIDVNGCFYTDPESGDIYYYDGNGKQVTGWLTIKSGEHAGKYYFHSLTGAAYRGGWYYVDNEYCHFDEKGVFLEKEIKPFGRAAEFDTFALEKDADGKDCIRAEFRVKGRVKSYCGDGNYYLLRVDSYSHKMLSLKPLHSISKEDGEFGGETFRYEFQIPLPREFDGDRNLQEVLMSKYALAVKSGENGYTVISSGAYVSNPEFAAKIDTPYYMPSSKKGIQGARAEWVIDAGTKNTLMNLDLKKVVLKGKQEGCVEYFYKGKVYYFDSLSALRGTVSRFNQEETDQYGRKREPVQITFAILMSYDSGLLDMIEPSARRAGAAPYYALNTRNQSSQERLEAVFSYLGEIFGQDDCYVSNWILGNEVNSCNAWNYTGGMGLSDFMKGYANAFRTLYSGVKQTRPSSRVFISLDNAWTQAVAGYAGKSVLNSFASQMYSEAPFVSWDLSFHPYSAPLTRTDFWNDGSNTTNSVNSPFISMRNLHYLNQYLADMENRYDRSSGSIKMILSEQGWTSTGSGGEKGQARALAQAYYIAEFNDRVLAFTIRAEKDDPREVRDGLSMGLRDEDEKYKPAYYVYRYMDTPVVPSSDSSEKLISEYDANSMWFPSNAQRNRFKAAQEVMAMNWKTLVPGYQEEKLNGMPYAFPM